MPKLRSNHIKNLVSAHKHNSSNPVSHGSETSINKKIKESYNYRSFSGDDYNLSENFFINTKEKISSSTPAQFLARYKPTSRTKIKKALEHWLSLKLPRPSRDHTKIQAYKALSYMLNIVGLDRLVEIFDQYAECLNHPASKFRKDKKPYRLPLWEFPKWDDYARAVTQAGSIFNKGDESMFEAFRNRTGEQIIQDFYFVKADTNPKVTQAIKNVWSKESSQQINLDTKGAQGNLVKISARFMKFWADYKGKLKPYDIPTKDRKKPEAWAKYLISQFLQNNPNYQLHYLNTDNFFDINLINFLSARGMIITAEERKTLKSRRRKGIKVTRSSGHKIKPSWRN